MKKLLLLIAALILLLAACDGSQEDAPPTGQARAAFVPTHEDASDYPGYAASIVTIDDVIEALQSNDEWVVIDVRRPEEFSGESRLPNAFGSGRLKGSVNVDRELVFDSAGEFLPVEDLVVLYDFIGERKAVVYCHGGVRSAFIWTILTDIGVDAYHYDGSWVEWSWAASVASDYPGDIVLSLTEEWTDNEGEI